MTDQARAVEAVLTGEQWCRFGKHWTEERIVKWSGPLEISGTVSCWECRHALRAHLRKLRGLAENEQISMDFETKTSVGRSIDDIIHLFEYEYGKDQP